MNIETQLRRAITRFNSGNLLFKNPKKSCSINFTITAIFIINLCIKEIKSCWFCTIRNKSRLPLQHIRDNARVDK